MNNQTRILGLAAAASLALASGSAAQQALYKVNNPDNLNQLTSWSTASGAQTPNPVTFNAGDQWYFNEVTMLGDKTVALGGNIAVGGLALDYVTSNTANSLVISAGNTLTLNGASLGGQGVAGASYTGAGMVLNRGVGGTLTIHADVALGAAQQWVVGRNTAGNPVTVTGAIALSTNNLTLNITGNAAAVSTFSGPISGSGKITKYGSSTLVLSGDNSGFSGGFQLGPDAGAANTGIVRVGHDNALGTGAVTVRGTQLQAAVAGITLPNNFNVGAGGFRLGGSNSFAVAGTTTIDSAQSRTIANYSPNASTVTLGGIVLTDAATAAFDNAANAATGAPIVVSGAISDTAGGGKVALSGNHNTTLNGTNTYTGATTLSGGRLTLNGSTGAGSAVAISGGAITGTGTINGALTMSGGSIALAGGATTTSLTFAQGVTFSGAPTVTFLAAPTSATVYDVFSYGTGTVTDGSLLTASCRGTLADDTVGKKYTFTAGEYGATRTWDVTDGTWDGTGTFANWAEGDQRFYAGDIAVFPEPAAASIVTLSGRVAPTSVTVNNTTNAYTLTGTAGTADLTGAASLTKNNAGTLTIGSIQTYTGGTTVNGGTLVLTASSGGTGTIRGTLTINSGAAVNVGGTDVLGYSTGADAVRTLDINGGTITQTQNRNETFTGTMNLTAATVAATGGASALFDLFGGSARVNVIADAISSVISSPIRLRQNDSVFDVQDGAAAQDLLVSGAISKGGEGNGAIVKNGDGTMVLSGNNTYTGNTTINAGVLELAAGARMYNGGYTNTPVITVNTGGTWRLPDYSYGGVGQLADYAGRRVLNGGTIEVTGGTHDSGQDFTVTATGGTFRYNPAVTTSTLTLRSNANTNITLNGPLTLDAVGNVTVAPVPADPSSDGVIAGTGSLTKTGAGTLTLGGVNTYTGTTTVAAGTLAVNGSSLADDGTLVIDGGVVDVTGTEVVNALYFGATPQETGKTYGAPGSGADVIDATRFSGTGVINLGAGFAGWIAGSFANGSVPAGQQGAYDDPDGDGLDNLIEYAIAGLDPTLAEGPAGTLAGTTLTFAKRQPLAADITYAIEESTDLGLTDPWAEVTPTSNNDTTISYTLPGGPPKDFIRLKVTQN